MAKCKQMEIKTAGKSKLRSTEKGWLGKMAGGKWVESRKCIMWNWARKYHTFPHALSFKPSLCVCVCVVCVTKFSTQLYAFFLAVVVYLPVISLHFPSSLIFFLLLQRRQFPASAAVCLLNWNNFPIFSLFGGLGRVFVFFQCVLALAGFTPRSIQGLSRSGPRIFRFRFYFFFFFFALCEITTSAFPFPFGWLVLARTLFLFLFLIRIRIRILALFLVLARDPALVGFWRYSACILWGFWHAWKMLAKDRAWHTVDVDFSIISFRFASLCSVSVRF